MYKKAACDRGTLGNTDLAY